MSYIHIHKGRDHYAKEFSEKILPDIMAFVRGEIEDKIESFYHYPLWAITDVLKENGFEILEWDSNGWQWDYWQEVSYEGVQYIVAGSGYYGGFRFYASEKDI